jgi:hypothetical protein
MPTSLSEGGGATGVRRPEGEGAGRVPGAGCHALGGGAEGEVPSGCGGGSRGSVWLQMRQSEAPSFQMCTAANVCQVLLC